MKIYIPSRGRSKEVSRGTISQLPPGVRASYVVPRGEFVAYREALERANYHHACVLECPEDGIAATRHWIGQDARECQERLFICLDDDVNFVVRKAEDDWHLRRAEFPDVAQMLHCVKNLLDNEGYSHVGIGTREGNNRLSGVYPIISENTRTLRCLAYRTEDFLSVEHGRVPVMEDFDVNLQLLRRGLKNCSVNYWAQDQKMTNAPGGCSTYRTKELHEAAARKLAELHPGLVSLRQKKNKTGGEFGERTEVTIQWKRAYGHG